MKLLKQIGLVFGLCWISQCIEAVLPISFPASVIAMVLLLVLLILRVVKVEHVREKSDFLLGNLPFFLIPVSVGILNYKDVILANGWAFLVICAVSTVVTFGATAWAVQLTMKLIDRRKTR